MIGIGGAGMSALADRRLRVGRRGVGLRPRRVDRIPSGSSGSVSTFREGHDPRPSASPAWRWWSRRPSPTSRRAGSRPRAWGCSCCPRASSAGRDGGGAPLDLRRRRPRQDDHRGDDRLRGAAAGAGSDLSDRRRGTSAGRKRRARRRRPAGRRGRRVGRQLRPAAPAGCGRSPTSISITTPRFGSLEEVRQLFADWVTTVPAGGAVILGDGVDCSGACAGARGSASPTVPTGTSPASRPPRAGQRFWLATPDGTPVARVAQRCPASTTPVNAAGATRGAGTPPGRTSPTRRQRWPSSRAPVAGSSCAAVADGVPIVDDYAHHPTEVAAVIDAARTQAPRRLVVCFQPHLYSRTRRWRTSSARALARRRRGGGDRDLRRPRAPRRGRHGQAGRRRRVSERRPGHAAGVHAAARGRGRVPARAGARRRPGADGGRGGRAPGGRPAAGDERRAGLRRARTTRSRG